MDNKSVNQLSMNVPPASNPASGGPSSHEARINPAQTKPQCCQCGKSLHPDEIGLTKKLINRGATEYFCLSCLAARFQVSEDDLRQKIREFRAMGCTLFP